MDKMKKRDWIVLAVVVSHGYENHKSIMQRTGYSLGLVNSALKKLVSEGYLDSAYAPTEKTKNHMESAKPRRAVILAAGMGLRMTPINRFPKGLLQINDEPIIERILKQLQSVGIQEIHIVVGYQRESLEYLTDKYGVRLIQNNDFAKRDSLHSLRLAVDKLSNCYIIPSDVWFAQNPFHEYEFFSWYAVSEFIDEESYIRLNRKMELTYTGDESGGNTMIGLCYLREEEAEKVREEIIRLDRLKVNARETWEKALFVGNKMLTNARTMLGQSAFEVKTYEQLRELDSESRNLRSKRIRLISEVFNTEPDAITDISGLFKGMTNHLMRFSVEDKPYLLRVPGEGSGELTNRRQEVDVYSVLSEKKMTDKVVYFSPADGYKITEFWPDARACDPASAQDVAACMKYLRELHGMKLEVSHSFDFMEKLKEYEDLCGGSFLYTDYEETREKVAELDKLLDMLPKESCLCHVDAIADNFLFVGESLYLIDWEYAGMCDPRADIAMFCIYADYDKEAIDRTIDLYYQGSATDIDIVVVYAYVAIGGFLWAVWCDYKDKMGVNYSQYAIKQYRYAKQFYRYAMQLLSK